MTAEDHHPEPRTARDTGETRERLIDAISTYGPITATSLAEQFGLTSAAVRRHLAALESEGIIEEHEVATPSRGRGRPSKSFVLSAAAHEDLRSEYDMLANLALDELARFGGEEALECLADARVAGWERDFAERVEAEEATSGPPDRSRRVELLAELLSEKGYASTVRPVSVPIPASGPQDQARTLSAAQLVQGHCPLQDVAERHPILCEAETRALGRMAGAPVQRLATLAGGAHACTTHIPLMEGRTL